MFRMPLRRSLLCALFVSILFGSLAASAADSCVTASLGEPFLLPDGTLKPAGDLTLCLDRDLNPVASIHTSYVDRSPIGMLSSVREIGSMESPDRCAINFLRNASDGRLRLTGYTVPDGDQVIRYQLNRKTSVHVQDSLSNSVRVPSRQVGLPPA